MRSRCTVAVFFAIAIAVPACDGTGAASPGDDETLRLFQAGNDRYAEGDYEAAAGIYRQLLNQGFRSGALHYNMGNALFRLGKLGPAILQYEKASRLSPNDLDVQANLEFARSLTVDKPVAADAQTTRFFMERLLDLTTLDQDAALLTAFYLIGSGLITLRLLATDRRARRLAAWGLVSAALPLILVTAVFLAKVYRQATIAHAVILQQRVDVRSGPGEDNTALFTIHEGLKVRLRNEQGSWAQISLDNGLNGWIPTAAFGEI